MDDHDRIRRWAVVQMRRVSGPRTGCARPSKAHPIRDFRTSLVRVTGADHAQTIIVALPDDSMGYVFDRLWEAGRVGALALLRGEQVSRIAILWPASPARVAVAEEDDSITQIHLDSPVGMCFDYLERIRTMVVQ